MKLDQKQGLPATIARACSLPVSREVFSLIHEELESIKRKGSRNTKVY